MIFELPPEVDSDQVMDVLGRARAEIAKGYDPWSYVRKYSPSGGVCPLGALAAVDGIAITQENWPMNGNVVDLFSPEAATAVDALDVYVVNTYGHRETNFARQIEKHAIDGLDGDAMLACFDGAIDLVNKASRS